MSQFTLPDLPGETPYAAAIVEHGDLVLWLTRRDADAAKRLAVLAPAGSPRLAAFAGATSELSGRTLLLAAADAGNAAALRDLLPWLRAQTLGLRTSAGFGDRLGLATPGHARAVRANPGIAPIYAQQSIRENVRTHRTAQQVMDAATWGVFEAGWRDGFGADGDHLKTPADADVMVAAGYTFFTIDPGEHVDDAAHTATYGELTGKVDALPWADLESSPGDLRDRFLGRSIDIGDMALAFDDETLARAAAKYGRAVAHAVRMYRHLAAINGDRPWEMELSVDETETPTSHREHLYIVTELRRLGVRWASLAPRYVGRFEKGVDYIGDLDALRADLAGHAAIARAFGPYKLSLHSGSDKFSVYPLAMEATGGMVHLKTAGTSMLAAQQAIAMTDPALFRQLYALAFERFAVDRASYHISADPARAPQPDRLADGDLPAVVDQFDARQMLHVTFGSAIMHYGPAMQAALRAHEETHYAALERHFNRHLAPFARSTA